MKINNMKQEDKQLLLVDLCARLPYGVMIEVQNELGKLTSINIDDNDEVIIYSGDCDEDAKIEYCKPYLRPMSSMTEAEMEEYNDTWELDRKDVLTVGEELENDYKHKGYESIWGHPVVPLYRYIDWLNKNMFDYRGLIPKGLALEAPSDMYKVEE